MALADANQFAICYNTRKVYQGKSELVVHERMQKYLRPMSEEDAYEVLSWRYEDEYTVYNFPDWEECVRRGYDITNEAMRRAQWISIFSGGVLIAFGRLTPLEHRILIGIGLRPDLCGKGLGKKVMRLLMNEANRRLPGATAALTVRTFNDRARKCYESLGFSVLTCYTGDASGERAEYYYMERMLLKGENL